MTPVSGAVSVVVPAALSGAAALGMVPFVLRRRSVPGALWYCVLLVAVVEWTVTSTTAMLVDSLRAKELLEQLGYFGVVIAPVAFLLFAVRFSRRHEWRRLGIGLLLAVPTVTLLLVWTNPLHGLMWTDISTVRRGGLELLRFSYGPWFGANVIYCYLLSTGGVFTLILRLSSTHLRFRFPVISVLAFPLVVGTVNLSYLSGVGGVLVDYTPVAYGTCAALMALALFREDLFELLPMARYAVLDTLTEIVIVVDNAGRVVDINLAGAKALNAPAPEIVGRHLSHHAPELAQASLDPPRTLEVQLACAPGRTFELRTSRFGLGDETRGGLLLVMRDISNRKEAERELVAAREKLELANRELQRLVDTDVLTGLSNRRYLIAKLDDEVSRSRRYDKPLGVIVLDLDHFKRVNDRYGHAVGDQVLAACAQVLVAIKRANDIAARYGGEEFVVLLPETDLEGAVAFAHRLRRDFNARMFDDGAGRSFRVTASYGVAALPGSRVDAEELLRLGDQRMYRAKQEGRDRVCAEGGEKGRSAAELGG